MKVLLTGDPTHRDFADAVRWLRSASDLESHPLENAAQWLAEAETSPTVIVIAQSRPGQFARQSVEQLHAAAPLSTVVALVGSWCEGETRTGHPWPGVIRIHGHQWGPRLHRILADHRAGTHALWPLRTITPEERLLKTLPRAENASAGKVGICAARGSYDWLACATSAIGFTPINLGRTLTAPGEANQTSREIACRMSVILWDVDGSRGDWQCPLSDFASRTAGTKILVSLGFPRREDSCLALRSGAAALISKPFSLLDLQYHLQALMPHVSGDTCESMPGDS